MAEPAARGVSRGWGGVGQEEAEEETAPPSGPS